jgi:hypothetical protein
VFPVRWRSRVGTFLGAESGAIRFERSGANWSVTAPPFLDMAASGAMGLNPALGRPLELDNTGHPAANRFALARASKSHVNALGLKCEDLSGTNNGQYAPFSWQGV